MKSDLNDFPDVKEESSEKIELKTLSKIRLDLYLKIDELKKGTQEFFFDELIRKIRSLVCDYILGKQNSKFTPNQKFLFLFYDLFNRILTETFMDQKFLMNFLYKIILLFYDPIHPKDSNVMIINDGILNLCKNQISPT